MVEAETHKRICRACFEEMHERAWRCPHCGAVRLRAAIVYTFLTVLPIVIAMLWAGSLFMSSMKAMFRPEPTDGRPAAALRVTESHLYTGETKDGPYAYVVGVVKNDGQQTAYDLRVVVRFLNKQGRVIDGAIREGWGDYLWPGDEITFKLGTKRDLPADDYADYSLNVAGVEYPSP